MLKRTHENEYDPSTKKIKHKKGVCFASKKLLEDKTFILEALKYDPDTLKIVEKDIVDSEILRQAAQYPFNISIEAFPAFDELTNDKKFILTIVKRAGYVLKYASLEVRNDRDREIVQEALKQNAIAFSLASTSLKKDRELVLEAVKYNTSVFKYTSPELKNDKEFVLKIVHQNGETLQFASQQLREDPEILLKAVEQNASIIGISPAAEFDRMQLLNLYVGYDASDGIPERLKKDYKFLLELSKYNGYALKFLPQEFKNNRPFVLELIQRDGCALQYASEALRNDRDLVLEAVRNDGEALINVENMFKNDREIVLIAIKQQGELLHYASSELQADREIALEAVKNNPEAIRFVSIDADFFKEIALQVVTKYPYCIQHIPEQLTRDRQFIWEALNRNIEVFDFIESYSVFKDTEFFFRVLDLEVGVMGALNQDRLIDKEFILKCVKKNGYALSYAGLLLQFDNDLIMEAMKQNGYVDFYDDEWYKKRMEYCYNGCFIP
ncbi:hypothetical protein FDP41_001597 [Naegleria fowleri]|uniref:DUF4116 domain-containing protein n=1 Tax=Naegleria fowleri TaxID=5763 RepID=A0A6A5BY57_NAEFO|nr:uncharacterized protein FDP41_001597 [Naegleria fowleri]KAF0979254.1 hypothetical protein FDP41_001597 [Naegleria fowleri]